MNSLQTLVEVFIKITPLYLLVALGYIAAKHFEFGITRKSISSILIYLLSPLVIFHGVILAPLNASLILVPLFFFILANVVSMIFYVVGNYLWRGPERYLFAFITSTGNTGYFGIPIVLALLGSQYFSAAVLSSLGFLLFQNSVGYYFIARGRHAARESLIRLLKLPTLYAFILGILFLFFHLSAPQALLTSLENIRGAYSVLGMMLIGLGSIGISRASLDLKFLTASFFARFVVWPALIIFIVFCDQLYLHLFTPAVYPVFLLMSIVPLASNSIAFAIQLDVLPEKVASAVFLSTVFALVYVPLFMVFIYPFVSGT